MDVIYLLLVIIVNCKKTVSLITIQISFFVKHIVLVFSLVRTAFFVKQIVLIFTLIRTAFLSSILNLKITKHL